MIIRNKSPKINVMHPLNGAKSHWSEFSDLITPQTLEYIQSCDPLTSSFSNTECLVSSFIAGLVLGDAAIRRTLPQHNSYLRLNLACNLRGLSFAATTACFLERINQGSGFIHCYKGSQNYVLAVWSSRHNKWNEARAFWYPEPFGVKTVPQNIAGFLNPMAVALWVIGDGSRAHTSDTPGLMFHTQSFSEGEHTLLAAALFKNFNVLFKMRHVKNKVKQMNVLVGGTKQSLILRKHIVPFMHHSWHYKLGKIT